MQPSAKKLSSVELSYWPPSVLLSCHCHSGTIQSCTAAPSTIMSPAGVSGQESRSALLLKQPPQLRLHNYVPRIKSDHPMQHKVQQVAPEGSHRFLPLMCQDLQRGMPSQQRRRVLCHP